MNTDKGGYEKKENVDVNQGLGLGQIGTPLFLAGLF
jgi:hypothetical protein